MSDLDGLCQKMKMRVYYIYPHAIYASRSQCAVTFPLFYNASSLASRERMYLSMLINVHQPAPQPSF